MASPETEGFLYLVHCDSLPPPTTTTATTQRAHFITFTSRLCYDAVSSHLTAVTWKSCFSNMSSFQEWGHSQEETLWDITVVNNWKEIIEQAWHLLQFSYLYLQNFMYLYTDILSMAACLLNKTMFIISLVRIYIYSAISYCDLNALVRSVPTTSLHLY